MCAIVFGFVILAETAFCFSAEPTNIESPAVDGQQEQKNNEHEKVEQSQKTRQDMEQFDLRLAPNKWSPVTFKTFLDSFYLVLELHGSVFTDSSNSRTAIGDSLGYGMKVGYRWGFISAFLHAEHNMWVSSEHEIRVVDGAFNIGPGIEINYLHGYLHSSIAFGASILLWDTVLDDAGSTGIFLDFRPLGLRWPLVEYFSINLDPLSFALIVPVLDGFPLVMMEYRTVLSTEFNF